MQSFQPIIKKALQYITDERTNTYWVADKAVNVIIDIIVPDQKTLNAVVLVAMIAFGQKVIGFSIELKRGNEFVKVYDGTTVG